MTISVLTPCVAGWTWRSLWNWLKIAFSKEAPMKYQVPPVPADAKAQLTEVTNQPEIIAAYEHPDSYVRGFEIDGRHYVYTSDLRKLRGEDVEIPIT